MAAEPTPSLKIHRIAFSHDRAFVSVAHEKGFSIFQTRTLEKMYELGFGGLSFAQQLFSTAAVFAVGSGETQSVSARSLHLINTSTGRADRTFMFETTVRGLQVNNKRIAVILEKEICIFNTAEMRHIHTIQTASNPDGLGTMTHGDISLLAYPAMESGCFTVYDALSCRDYCPSFSAHNTALQTLAFNSTGTFLATASGKGTIIRVFTFSGGSAQIAFEFRRGSTPAQICHLEFAPPDFGDHPLLACASKHGSVHIFKLSPECKYQPPSGVWGYLPIYTEYRGTYKWHYPSQQPNQTIITAFMSPRTILVGSHDGKIHLLELNTPDCLVKNTFTLIPSVREELSALSHQITADVAAAPPPHHHLASPSAPHSAASPSAGYGQLAHPLAADLDRHGAPSPGAAVLGGGAAGASIGGGVILGTHDVPPGASLGGGTIAQP